VAQEVALASSSMKRFRAPLLALQRVLAKPGGIANRSATLLKKERCGVYVTAPNGKAAADEGPGGLRAEALAVERLRPLEASSIARAPMRAPAQRPRTQASARFDSGA